MPQIAPVSYQTLVRIFESDGFAFVRQRGDHLIYTKAGVKRPLVIPTYRSVPVFIIKNLLRTSGMSRQRYFPVTRGLSVGRFRGLSGSTCCVKRERPIAFAWARAVVGTVNRVGGRAFRLFGRSGGARTKNVEQLEPGSTLDDT